MWDFPAWERPVKVSIINGIRMNCRITEGRIYNSCKPCAEYGGESTLWVNVSQEKVFIGPVKQRTVKKVSDTRVGRQIDQNRNECENTEEFWKTS
jgi:hypothetical protein